MGEETKVFTSLFTRKCVYFLNTPLLTSQLPTQSNIGREINLEIGIECSCIEECFFLYCIYIVYVMNHKLHVRRLIHLLRWGSNKNKTIVDCISPAPILDLVTRGAPGHTGSYSSFVFYTNCLKCITFAKSKRCQDV